MTARDRRRAALKYTLLSLLAIPWVVVPAALVLLNSAKPEGEAALLNLSPPSEWRIAENYGRVFTDGHYWAALGNTVAVTAPIVLGVVVFGAMAAWAFGRSNGRLTKVGYFTIILSILVPPAVIPTIQLLRWLHVGTVPPSYVFVMIATRMGLLVFLATGFVRSLPRDLEEAAQIDGASNRRIFWSIIVPLLRPVLFVGAVILTITVWGDFFYAQFLLPTVDDQTLQLALYAFASQSSKSLNWNLVFAHLVMTNVPLIVMYLVAQKHVVSGLSEGALKG